MLERDTANGPTTLVTYSCPILRNLTVLITFGTLYVQTLVFLRTEGYVNTGKYEGVSKSFLTGRLEPELQMV
jgi:hypothetical protein